MSTDDFASSTNTTGILNINDSVTGEINDFSDEDWFKVSLTEGKTYHIDLLGEPTDSGTLSDPYLKGVYNSRGNYISFGNSDEFKTLNDRLFFTPSTSDNYFIAAKGYGRATGTYQLSINETPDSIDSLRPVLKAFSLNETVNTTSGDSTLALSFQTHDEQSGIEDIEINFNNPFIATSDLFGDPNVDFKGYSILFNSAWESWADNIDVSLNLSNANPSGTFLVSQIVLRDKAGFVTYYDSDELAALGFSNEFTLISSGDDFTDDIHTAGILTLNDSVTGEISSGADVDWFKISLTAGQTYQIDLLGQPTSSGSLADPYLQGVYDSDGDTIIGTSNDDFEGSANSRVFFNPSSNGDYYIAASGRNYGTGTYQIRVSDTLDPIDSQPPVLEAFSLSEEVNTATGDGILALSLQTSDNQSGIEEVEIHFNESSPFVTTADFLDNPNVDFNGATIRINSAWEDWSDHINLAFEVSNANPQGVFQIGAVILTDRAGLETFYGYEDLAELGFSNEFTLISSGDDFSDDIMTTGVLMINDSVNGEISSGADEDWFKVTLTADKSIKLTFRMT